MPAKQAQMKYWTFMVYMAGDNDLETDGIKDLKEMKKVGSTDDVNLIAQFDRATGHLCKRYYLRKGRKVDADAVATVGKVNTGDPKRLMDFIKWGVKTYPAKHYILVLWNHGRGWDDTDIFADERPRKSHRLATERRPRHIFHTHAQQAFKPVFGDSATHAILLDALIDDNARDFLDNQEMKKVLAGTKKLLKRKLDILGMDACLMSMAEVGYQICDSAAFIVGSEETEPLEGWPYDTILTELVKNPAMTAQDLSSLIVDKYIASCVRDAVTQAACDLSKAEVLATAVAHLSNALTAGLADAPTRLNILTARTQAQTYEVKDNIDLADFCSLLAKAAAGSEIAKRCQDVVQAVQSSYVVTNGYRGTAMKDSHGVAIYFPTSDVSPLYAGLDFSKKTGWDSFLKAYLTAVRSR